MENKGLEYSGEGFIISPDLHFFIRSQIFGSGPQKMDERFILAIFMHQRSLMTRHSYL